jgi:methionyl-tRNA formyltransferase
LKLAFFGTPEVAATTLRALAKAGYQITSVVTRRDARRGRGGRVSPSPVKAAAQELGLPVAHDPEEAARSGAELGVVVAYGRIIKPGVLAVLPMVNVHLSLLPRWRGAAPVERAILAGDTETGVCIMKLDEGLDTGPVFGCEKVDIGEEETAPELSRRLGDLGTKLLLRMLTEGFPAPSPQVGEPTYAPKLGPAERHLDFAQPALSCLRVVRVGKAWTTWRGKRLLVHRARLVPGRSTGSVLSPGELSGNLVGTGEDVLELLVVQPEGKAPMPAAEWLRGARPKPAERLGP